MVLQAESSDMQFLNRLDGNASDEEDFMSLTVVCPDGNKLPFKIKPHVNMVRLMNIFIRREGLENIEHLVFYSHGMRIQPHQTASSLGLSDGDTIKTHIQSEALEIA